jgi:hypothetical protein
MAELLIQFLKCGRVFDKVGNVLLGINKYSCLKDTVQCLGEISTTMWRGDEGYSRYCLNNCFVFGVMLPLYICLRR